MAKKKKTVRRGDRAFKKDLQGQILDGLQMVAGAAQHSLLRSTGITFRIGRADLRTHFQKRETFWLAYASGLEDGSVDLGLPEAYYPRPIDAEFETQRKIDDVQILKMKAQQKKSAIDFAKQRAAAFAFMAAYLEDGAEFVLDIDTAALFDLAPAFGRNAGGFGIGAVM